MDFKARIEAKKKERDAALAALSDDDKTEIADRAALAKLDEEVAEAKIAARDLDLARRLDALQEQHPGVKFRTVVVKNFDDTFIVRHDQVAFAKWQRAINRKGDHEDDTRAYAVAAVVDWNGRTDFAPPSTLGADLHAYFKANTGVVGPVSIEAGELAGIFKEERKSG